MQSIKVTSQPALEPVSVAEIKNFLRIDITADDGLISDLIIAARQLAEEYTRRKFISTAITLTLDCWPTSRGEMWWDGSRDGYIGEIDGHAKFIRLPYAPILSVTSITTYDDDSVASVYDAANYRLDEAGRVYLNQGAVWPINLRDYNAIAVAYAAGYGTSPSSVPAAIRHGIKITVASMYENRECFEMPMAAKSALMPYRIMDERTNGV